MHLVNRLVPGLVAGSLVLGAASGVFAAKAPRVHTAVAFGQVSNLSTAGFTLTRTPKSGTPVTVNVTLAATTKEKALKGTTGALADGEYAAVIGPKSTAGIAANRVAFSVKPGPARRVAVRLNRHLLRRAAGTVSQTGTGTFSITTAKNKTVTFTVTTTTRVVASKKVTTTPSIATGERVVVFFRRDAKTKTLTAVRVSVRPAKTA
jgi:hypothetical protein